MVHCFTLLPVSCEPHAPERDTFLQAIHRAAAHVWACGCRRTRTLGEARQAVAVATAPASAPVQPSAHVRGRANALRLAEHGRTLRAGRKGKHRIALARTQIDEREHLAANRLIHRPVNEVVAPLHRLSRARQLQQGLAYRVEDCLVCQLHAPMLAGSRSLRRSEQTALHCRHPRKRSPL